MDVFGGADSAQGVALDARIGGSPLNVAIGLARLAQPVAGWRQPQQWPARP